jgi:hypothetical protein
MSDLERKVGEAVKIFWKTRQKQGIHQGSRSGRKDSGNRCLVTGGKQMAGFESLIEDLLIGAGIPRESIYSTSKRELPGYFRAEKNWDLVVVHRGALVAAMEFKSQVGSFGNNFNNRTEEALGNATDLWTAYREGAFAPSARPWLGFLMMLEDAPSANTPVSVKQPHFKVFDDFQNASYAKRYELLTIRLLRERLYDGACLLLSDGSGGMRGKYRETNAEINFRAFAQSLLAHATRHVLDAE